MATVSDNFNRADGALGANWSASNAGSAPVIVSNQVKAGVSATYVEAAYTGSSLSGSDQSIQVTSQGTEATSVVNLLLRMSSLTSSRNGYIGQFNKIVGFYKIIRIDAGVETDLVTTAIGAITNGDALYFEAIGSALKLKQNSSTILTFTDAIYNTVGTPAVGIYANTDAVIVDDFTASDITSSASYQPVYYQSRTIRFF